MVGLGPAGPDQLTVAAVRAIDRVPPGRRFLRTTRHPAAVAVGEGTASFDRLYESAATIDDVYAGIVDALVEAAVAEAEVLYAVPGSPLVAERTVELLVADPRVTVELVPGMSFADLAWARLGVDPVAAGARLVDGHRFSVEAAGERGPLLVAQCDSKAVLSDIKLSVESGGPDVVVLSRLGLPDESVRTVAWDDLDREVAPDHLTSLFVPVMAAPVAGEVVRFAELVRTLRQRCPWDREQTHASLTRHLLEETYEVLEAIGALDPSADDGADSGFDHLEEELGDLLFQVVFHATLAAEEGRFTLADVARGIHDKLVHRHPHVFGEVQAETSGQVVQNWERIKKEEKGRTSLMEGIAADLPSLLYAYKVQRKAQTVGLDPVEVEVEFEGAAAAVVVGAGGPAVTDTVAAGQLLFEAVDRIRRGGIDPEAALRAATARFRDRFMATERAAAEGGLDLGSLDPATVTRLWQRARSTGQATGQATG
ncbi:MAG: tetrapyrrole methylase family protein / MazG family protein [Actinomycetota bacterium]|nr:tetrapyrrole methylase family protein / MazG family protein [Actinomycetota bacterium]